MIPAAFRYHRVKTLAEAEKLLAASPEAKLLAGGQTLIAAMKMRLARPSDLVDISGLKELSFIRATGGALVVGAGATHNDIANSPEVLRLLPALAELAGGIGDPAVRHVGTLGGSVANNDPTADYPAALLALGATVTTNRRTIAADGFFTGMFSTALAGGEIVTSVSFPVPERASYRKFRNPASHYAMAGIFVAKTKVEVRVAVTGAAPCVFRAREMETALSENFSPAALNGIDVDPSGLNSDIHASADYRAHLVSVMAKRAVEALA
ncbi:MAG: xanthine dehydrogenase family protein subunit M [Alphaproteobacteria bacterium]|nr:xanthine dehydrogenase family protein subunit M [Alphaproteobacteria bacterium]